MQWGLVTYFLPLHQRELLPNPWKIAIYILLILCFMYILFLVTCFLFCVCILPTASLTCSMFLVLLQFVDILLFHVSGLSAVCRYFYCFMFQVLWFFLMLWFWFRVSCHLNFPLFCIALWECYLDKRFFFLVPSWFEFQGCRNEGETRKLFGHVFYKFCREEY